MNLIFAQICGLETCGDPEVLLTPSSQPVIIGSIVKRHFSGLLQKFDVFLYEWYRFRHNIPCGQSLGKSGVLAKKTFGPNYDNHMLLLFDIVFAAQWDCPFVTVLDRSTKHSCCRLLSRSVLTASGFVKHAYFICQRRR